MSSRFVRASKFRHVFAEPAKPESHYVDLDLAPTTGDHNYIRGNAKFFAVAVRGGGGPVLVLPYSATGKLPRGYPTVNGHSAAVYDTAWNPFNDNMLATGSDDTTVKLWSIPDGGLTETLKDPLATLSGHGKPVSLLAWHPTANNVIASVGKDPAVKVWDVEKAAARASIDAFGGLVQDIAWNSSGSLLATSAKDRVAKIFDPRNPGATATEFTPHEGGKAFKILFLGETGQLLTVGFTKQSKREMKLWDAKNFSAPLTTMEIDQAAGVMMPFYDEDLKMLYLTGKGDGNVRYYELTDEAPYLFALAEHRTNVSTKGADFLPKRCLAPLRCEVARMLKLTSDSMEPISFIVPRKSESFQEDIFPDTAAGVPSQGADAYFAGGNAAAKKVSMDPAKGGAVSSAPAAFKPAPASSGGAAASAPVPAPSPISSPKSASSTAGSGSTGGAAASSADVDAANKRAKAAEDRAKAAEAQVAELKSALATASAAAASSGAGGDSAALEAEVAKLKTALAAANARVAALEGAESKLKQVAAIINA